ncbi:putative enzyme related to lactoylglutathione lyase [Streptacidiphilus sp. MAP12-16]|uniref:VOC family protein n=1 Tax=Streptacidiphilus sp. MAP12-16 TaxID=3156300 RepID=UPI003512B000
MLSTSFVPGSPTWIDIAIPETAATSAFYGELFGWESVSAGPDAGGYGFFNLQGDMAGGFGPQMEEGASSAWMVYFGTTDADATTKSAEQAGGTVRSAVFDVMTSGRMAQLTDPTGGEFALWQPIEHTGLKAVNVPGSLAWVELHTGDVAAARAFYTSILGWTATDQDMGEFTYTVLSTGGEEDSFGGLMPAMDGEPPHWQPYFEVADCDATVAKLLRLGGKVTHPAQSAPGIGRMAAATDPNGAPFSVITSEVPS